MKSEKRDFEKAFIFAVLFATLACISIGTVSAAQTHYVNPGELIQGAIDNATAGDIIIVRDGTYTENVDVNVTNLTIKSENGSTSCIVQAASASDHVFEVTADFVNITGFTAKVATRYLRAGIYLGGVEHCAISGNNASNSGCGIYLDSSSNNTLTNNTASNNNVGGIVLSSSSNNTLTNNTANSNNNVGGIVLSSSSNNTLTNNTANSNYDYGIYLHFSSNNTLNNNTMSGNTYNFCVYSCSLSGYTQNIDTSNTVDGKPVYYWINQQDKQIPDDAGYVGVVNSTNITVKDLTLSHNREGVLFVYTNNSKIENVSASNNDDYGIYLYSSSNNNLTGNNASNNDYGIYLYSSSNNNLTGNNALSNNHYFGIVPGIGSDIGSGISLYSSSNNNLISNTVNSNV